MTLHVTRIGILSLLGVCATAGVLGSLAKADSPDQYPYDPACQWGRLADGHGMLLRCLQPAEASQLLASQVAASGNPDAAKGGHPGPVGADTQVNPIAPAAVKPKALILSRIGPAQADAGELPLAAKKLGLAEDKIVACVEANGGLSADPGRVVLRFLVRERGRAEGVTVKSAAGVSKKAADCIATVVDRRYVGYPAAPIVGATLPLELSAKH